MKNITKIVFYLPPKIIRFEKIMVKIFNHCRRLSLQTKPGTTGVPGYGLILFRKAARRYDYRKDVKTAGVLTYRIPGTIRTPGYNCFFVETRHAVSLQKKDPIPDFAMATPSHISNNVQQGCQNRGGFDLHENRGPQGPPATMLYDNCRVGN